MAVIEITANNPDARPNATVKSFFIFCNHSTPLGVPVGG
jgi:hypothetical protein